MSEADSLLAAAREYKAAQNTAVEQAQDQLQSYKLAVSELFTQMEGWLQELTSEGLIEIYRTTKEVADSSIPSTQNRFYEIDHMEIRTQKKCARFVPAGLYFIRLWDVINVDIPGASKGVSFCRLSANAPFIIKYDGATAKDVDLTKESFSTLLKALFQ